MNVANFLARCGRVFADRPAVALGAETVVTWRGLAERAARIAAGLRALPGIEPGDRVALAMKNCPAYVEALFAVWHGGLAAVPMNAKLHPREHAWILEDSGARACLATPELIPGLAEAAAGIPGLEAPIDIAGRGYAALCRAEPMAMEAAAPDALAWLFYTSGTTGRPKGAMLTHRNLTMMTLAYFADVEPVGVEDSIVHAAPMSHGSGLYMLPFAAQGACQTIPDSGGFDAAEFLALLPARPGASAFLAPTMVTRLIGAPSFAAADLANLRTVVYGGAPMYAEDCLRALDALGPKLVQIYGQGEAPMTITGLPRSIFAERGHPRFMERIASAGFARSGVEVRVADGEDRGLPEGEVGEVLARGEVVMPGYWRNPRATAETLRGGWLHTGDVGAFDADGYLTLKDRSKDVIISGGSNVYPREVEEALLRHPGVLEVSVVGRPDRDWGESVAAFVVPRPGAALDEAELDRLCIAHIARFKRPRTYRFVETLPKNDYGKVLKTALREALDQPQRIPGRRPDSAA